MGYLLLGLFLLWFLVGLGSAAYLVWYAKSRPMSWLWLAPVLVGGAVLGWRWSDLEYFSEADLRIEGFPLPVAAFERIEENRWRDYPGPPAFFITNFIIGLTTPLIPCAAALLMGRKFRKRALIPTEKSSAGSGPSQPSP